MGQDGVDDVLGVTVLGEDFTVLHLGHDLLDKAETLAVGLLNGLLAEEVDLTGIVGCLLALALQGNGGLHQLLQTLSSNGGRLHHGAAQGFGQLLHMDVGVLLGDDVGLVQRHHHGDAQLQQLGGKEQAAAEVGGIDDVDDGVDVLILDVGAGHVLLRSKRRHGVSTGQVHGDKLLIAGVDLLDGGFLAVNGDTGPVADLLIPAGEGIVHGGLAAVGITGKSNSHGWFSSSFFSVSPH